ncbi:MAG: DUF2784 domain-containing protein [Planctomycetota bacterium]
MNPALLADLIVAVHLGIVLFVLVGQLLILIGWPLRWRFVRNLWFRLAHLLVILVVAVQAAGGVLCPLTTWELELRHEAGQRGEEGTFVGRLLRDLLYVDVPSETLNIVYIAFAGLVLLSLFLVPPRWRWRRRAAQP